MHNLQSDRFEPININVKYLPRIDLKVLNVSGARTGLVIPI